MTTRKRAVAGPVLAAIVPSSALPALGGAAPGRDITVRENVRSVKFVHHSRSTRGERLSTGDV